MCIRDSLSTDADYPTQFAVALPPQTFDQGFTIELTDDRGRTMEVTKPAESASPVTIVRREFYAMKAIEFKPEPEAVDLGKPANCYVVSQAGTYMFPAELVDGTAIKGSFDKVDWTWRTTGVELSDIAYVDGYIRFTVKKFVKGNASISAYDAQQHLMLYNWHIWLTDAPQEMGTVAGASSPVFLDRKIGAVATDPNDPNSYGLLYQWGRKDPFTSAGTFTIINEDYSYQVDGERPIYNILNEELPKMRTRAEYHGTIAKSLRNPAVFYAMTYNFTGETDEYGQEIVLNDYRTKDWTDVSNDDYWGGVSGKKTIYDPCPVGYKVPTCDKDGNTPYAWLVYADMTWDDTNHGATQNGQWFPAAGTRVYASGGLDHQELNPYGGMWIGTAGKASANIEEYPELYGQYMFIVNGKRTFKVSKDARSQGMSMRCVKE